MILATLRLFETPPLLTILNIGKDQKISIFQAPNPKLSSMHNYCLCSDGNPIVPETLENLEKTNYEYLLRYIVMKSFTLDRSLTIGYQKLILTNQIIESSWFIGISSLVVMRYFVDHDNMGVILGLVDSAPCCGIKSQIKLCKLLNQDIDVNHICSIKAFSFHPFCYFLKLFENERMPPNVANRVEYRPRSDLEAFQKHSGGLKVSGLSNAPFNPMFSDNPNKYSDFCITNILSISIVGIATLSFSIEYKPILHFRNMHSHNRVNTPDNIALGLYCSISSILTNRLGTH